MQTSQLSQAGFYLLGALVHLRQGKVVKVHGLLQLQSWIAEHWHVECAMIELVQAKRWLVENELAEERPLGYVVTELGCEYLEYKLPEFMPLAPLYSEGDGLKLPDPVRRQAQPGTKAAKRHRY